ncbi:DUF1059 domain-containing protein [Nitrosopumilus sp.]|uniref:DUF1059 domain-containing protein n=1 Tax=Nitrosopumilus sp. TaxID=2024843 RepID=UPI00260CB603|nr:DUF1059 domain-containing protein [Nitrosopumilus sp.]
MAELKARTYGFDDDFVVTGEVEEVIEKFKVHMEKEHGIEYSIEALNQFLLRMKN